MKPITITFILTIAFLSGCAPTVEKAGDIEAGSSSESGRMGRASTPSTSVDSGAGGEVGSDVAQGPTLGQMLTAGHFSVILVTEDKSPKPGNVKFFAQVGHHGAPSTEATVTLKMRRNGSEENIAPVTMKHVADGRFEGTAKLSEAGEYVVDMDISEGQGHGGSTSMTFKLGE